MEKLSRSVLLVLLLTPLGFGCSSALYFHRDPLSDRVTSSEWHHSGFVELSEPISLTERCMGEPWETVKISKNIPMTLLTSFTLGLYDPLDVSYACKGD